MRGVPLFVNIRLRRKIVHVSSSIRFYRELGHCVFVLRAHEAIKGGTAARRQNGGRRNVTCEKREKAAANRAPTSLAAACRFALWIFLLHKLTTTRVNCLQLSCDAVLQSGFGLKRKARRGRADGPLVFRGTNTKSTHEQIIRRWLIFYLHRPYTTAKMNDVDPHAWLTQTLSASLKAGRSLTSTSSCRGTSRPERSQLDGESTNHCLRQKQSQPS